MVLKQSKPNSDLQNEPKLADSSKSSLIEELKTEQSATFKLGTPLSKTTLKSLNDLLQNAIGGKVSLFCKQIGAPLLNESYDYKEIVIDHKNVSDRAISFDGSIQLISFQIPGKVENKDKVRDWSDKLGNIYFSNTFEDEDGKLIEDVYIFPKVGLATSTSSITQENPITLDLSYFGIGVVDGAWKQKIIPLGGSSGGKAEYLINLDSTSVTSEDVKKGICGAVVAGANTAERLFGIEAGKLVKHIVIVESEEEAAMFNPSSPNAIFIGHSILKSDVKQLVALNEATHLIDYHYKISDGSFKAFVIQLLSTNEGRAFIDILQEYKFLPGVKNMGHSPDEREYQYQELFGAFIASLQHPKLEVKLSELSKTDKAFYAELCRVTLNRLDEISRIASERGEVFAPTLIHKKISDALKMIPN